MLLVEQNLAVVRRLARDAVVLAAGRVAYDRRRRASCSLTPELTRALLGVGRPARPADAADEHRRPADADRARPGRRCTSWSPPACRWSSAWPTCSTSRTGCSCPSARTRTWWAAGNLPGAGADGLRLRARRRLRRGRRRGGRGAGRAGADPAAVLAAPSNRCWSPSGCRWPGWRCCRRSGAPTPGPSRGRTWTRQVTAVARRPGAQRPAAADRRRGAWCSAALLAFLRFTRYGLVIRAGVEDRAMVTALGIDVRKAFTLVFAIGGAAAALAGALGGRLLRLGLARPGQLAADLRVHRGGHRRHGLGGRLRAAPRSRSGWCSSSSTTTARPGSATSAWSRCSPSCCWSARRASPERWPRHDARDEAPRTGAAPRRDRPGCAGLRRSCRWSRWWCSAIAAVLDARPAGAVRRAAQLARHPATARHLPGLRRPGRRLRPAVRPDRACSPSGTRSTSPPASTAPTSWSPRPAAAVAGGAAGRRRRRRSLAALLGAVALRTGGIAFAMVTLAFAQVGAILVARDPGGLTGGEEGLPLDVPGLPAGAGRRRQHGQPVLAGAGVPGRGGLRGAPGRRRRRPAGCWPGSATTSGGSGCSGCDPYRLQAGRVHPGRRRWPRPAGWSTAARRRRVAAHHRPPT